MRFRSFRLAEYPALVGGIRALQEYLKLEPAAATARAAQLRIYQWESLAPRAAKQDGY